MFDYFNIWILYHYCLLSSMSVLANIKQLIHIISLWTTASSNTTLKFLGEIDLIPHLFSFTTGYSSNRDNLTSSSDNKAKISTPISKGISLVLILDSGGLKWICTLFFLRQWLPKIKTHSNLRNKFWKASISLTLTGMTTSISSLWTLVLIAYYSFCPWIY